MNMALELKHGRNEKDSNKEFDYRNMPNLDDDSEENIKKVEDMMDFFYNQELEKKKKD